MYEKATSLRLYFEEEKSNWVARIMNITHDKILSKAEITPPHHQKSGLGLESWDNNWKCYDDDNNNNNNNSSNYNSSLDLYNRQNYYNTTPNNTNNITEEFEYEIPNQDEDVVNKIDININNYDYKSNKELLSPNLKKHKKFETPYLNKTNN
jgi:hypothetical protein